MLTYLQAVVIGALQGVTELFPISSLGHSVLVPAWIGGSWNTLVTQGDSYLAFVVGLHVATALALLAFYRRDWVRVLGALATSVRERRVDTSSQRLAWLLVVATIPTGLLGLAFEHPLRMLFATPVVAAAFLMVNGVILAIGEFLRRRAGSRSLDEMSIVEASGIGLAQSLALLAGISRSGVTMVGGLLRGLDHEDAAKFAFLLATPIILAAGALKLPELAAASGVDGQVLAGSVVAAVAAYLSVKFLTRYFEHRTLLPFAIYCVIAGAASVVHFA